MSDYALNYYGFPITPPEYFDGLHVANTPPEGGSPPICSCGWTRWQTENGYWFEMSEHLRDMGEFAIGAAE